MKFKMLSLIGLILVANLMTLALTPAISFGASDEIGSLIDEQLQPVEDIYGQDDVNSTTLAQSVANIVKIALGFLGILFLVLILYAGFMWMTAAGNDDKIDKAKKIISAAVIGVAIVVSAYIITYFVIDNLLLATGAEGFGN